MQRQFILCDPVTSQSCLRRPSVLHRTFLSHSSDLVNDRLTTVTPNLSALWTVCAAHSATPPRSARAREGRTHLSHSSRRTLADSPRSGAALHSAHGEPVPSRPRASAGAIPAPDEAPQHPGTSPWTRQTRVASRRRAVLESAGARAGPTHRMGQ
jgi:hypothetical protein